MKDSLSAHRDKSTRLQPRDTISSCRDSESTVFDKEPVRAQMVSSYESLVYVTIMVPWTTSLACLYILVSALPLLFLTICRQTSLQDRVLQVNRILYAIHERQLCMSLPESVTKLFLLQLSAPVIALGVALGGFLASFSQLYSFILSEQGGPRSILTYTMQSWYWWASLFCEPTPEPKLHIGSDAV